LSYVSSMAVALGNFDVCDEYTQIGAQVSAQPCGT